MSRITDSMLSLFATPVINTQLPSIAVNNPALAEFIRAKSAEGAGVARSNVGSWHSDNGFLEEAHPAVAALRHAIHETVLELSRTVARNPVDPRHGRFRLEGWANRSGFGAYHSVHSHPNACWSGVYYVTGNPGETPEHPMSGRLELIDPRPGASLSYADHTALYGRCMINPSPGQLVIFPGWLSHMVHPYFGDDERITVAFNASFPDER